MICSMCDAKGVKLRRITKATGVGPELLVIEDVPVYSCPNCGGMYFDGSTMKELERISRERKEVAVKRLVEVARFGVTPRRRARAGANGVSARNRKHSARQRSQTGFD